MKKSTCKVQLQRVGDAENPAQRVTANNTSEPQSERLIRRSVGAASRDRYLTRAC